MAARSGSPVEITPVGTPRLPLPRRVATVLREIIRTGGWSGGQRLPTESILADQLKVSRATLREAFRVLESEGLLIRRDGVGTFVASGGDLIRPGIERLYGITELIRRAGYEPSVRSLDVVMEPVVPFVAEALSVATESDVYHVSRTYAASGFPVVQCEDFIPDNLVPANSGLRNFGGEVSLYEFLSERCGLEIERAVATIVPVLASGALAKQLSMVAGEPILLLDQIHYIHDGTPVLFSRNYHNSRGIRFQVVRTREW